MSETQTLLLAAIAGMTILFGLPVGRLRQPRPSLRLFLNAVAIGVLTFLVWDVLSAGFEPIDAALGHVHDHTGGLAPVFGYGSLFFGGIGLGLIGLAYYEQFLIRRPAPRSVGAMVATEQARPAWRISTWTPARRTALLVAVGIGLHNFGEGLAIGGSAARGQISLATLLIIGFGLHNATEGFGIVAPLSGETERPTWGFLAVMGLIGGGPTFFGTLVGHAFSSDALGVAFLALAAGSILYVVMQLLSVAFKAGRQVVLVWGVFVGLLAGFATDMIVTSAGV